MRQIIFLNEISTEAAIAINNLEYQIEQIKNSTNIPGYKKKKMINSLKEKIKDIKKNRHAIDKKPNKKKSDEEEQE